MQGVVKWFDPVRSFGFIYCPEMAGDFFVHARNILPGEDGFRRLRKDERVEFDPKKELKGMVAYNVRHMEGDQRELLKFRGDVPVDDPQTPVVGKIRNANRKI